MTSTQETAAVTTGAAGILSIIHSIQQDSKLIGSKGRDNIINRTKGKEETGLWGTEGWWCFSNCSGFFMNEFQRRHKGLGRLFT